MNVDVQNRTGTTLVLAAQAGDPQAREALVATWLPLVYNVAGRALNGHADVDDIAQETMIRALDGLDGLRDPESFRSWLVAITMNQVRRRSASQQQTAVGGLDETWELPDPEGDFTDLTILRLGLSGQRREVAEATRWLDPDDRELLALWWLEACGELTRAELTEALDLTPQHTAVRIQRMKKQLEAGRLVVRALTAYPRCPELADLTAGWDGAPGSVWRKRIVRHIRACPACDRLGRDLFPAEGLLAGLVLVPFPSGSPTALPVQPTAAAGLADPSGGPGGRGGPTRRRAAVAGGAAAVLAVTTLALVWPHHAAPESPATEPTTPAGAPDTLVAAIPTPPTTTPPTPPTTAEPVTAPAAPLPTRAPEPAPTTPTPVSARPTAPPSPERQLVDLVNAERARAGCGPLRIDPKLHAAAQKHAEDMVTRAFFDHVNPDGARADARLAAAGYRWSQWGENLDRGPGSAAAVFSRWMDGGIHQSNMLDCGFKDVGVGVATGPGGPYWTQDLGTALG
ncbi:sigma-70 family RNA polymerase sigma factor [Kitasatospora sp. NPDC087315]|uniref:sigma-70 family RNA polymerase sigma factor n=1 Tax=Kitasatospora sp. NPDC087315 TaxID=3364069 RepID=UPI0038148ACC